MMELVRTSVLALAIVSACCGNAAFAQETPSKDAAVATEIEHRFSEDRAINAQAVEITVRDGTVVLTGRVPDEAAKAHAERLANAVDGVDHVDNRLTPAVGGKQPAAHDGRSIPERMPGSE